MLLIALLLAQSLFVESPTLLNVCETVNSLAVHRDKNMGLEGAASLSSLLRPPGGSTHAATDRSRVAKGKERKGRERKGSGSCGVLGGGHPQPDRDGPPAGRPGRARGCSR